MVDDAVDVVDAVVVVLVAVDVAVGQTLVVDLLDALQLHQRFDAEMVQRIQSGRRRQRRWIAHLHLHGVVRMR